MAQAVRVIVNDPSWSTLPSSLRELIAQRVDKALGAGVGRELVGHRERSGEWRDANRIAQPAAEDTADPWEFLDVDAAEPEPLPARGRGLLAFGDAVVSVVAHGKVGKTTYAWCDLAPLTRERKVLAIVGKRELGPEGRRSYSRVIYGAGGDPGNVAIMEPAPGIVDVLAGRNIAETFDAVVIDSAATLCEALGLNENLQADVDPLLTKIGEWGIFTAIIRHSVNSGSDPRQRDATASKGAGSRRWLAGVDAELTLQRDGNTTVAKWAGRDGLPDVTAMTLDKTCWPWGVEIIENPELAPAGPGGGGGVRVTDESAEQAIRDALVGATPDQPFLMERVRSNVASVTGRRDPAGGWFSPYRRAVDRLYEQGEIGANDAFGVDAEGAWILTSCGEWLRVGQLSVGQVAARLGVDDGSGGPPTD